MKVELGTNKYTVIQANNEPGLGGAYAAYDIVNATTGTLVTRVSFQNGPLKESAINGCHHEDLLNIVIHRLQCYQAGALACDENQNAINAIDKALHYLRARTKERGDRGVEGTSAA